METTVVRIFLASPSADTQPARQTVVQTLRELQADQEFAARLRIELLRWDDEMRVVMCEADHTPQLDIHEQIGHPRECELLIGLFAHTMGGALQDQPPFGCHASGRLWHCTEWEIEQALQGKRDGTVRSVWLFRDQCRQPDPPEHFSADEEDDYRRQSTAVRRYLEGDRKSGQPLARGFQLFQDQEDLARRLRTGLRAWLRRHFPAQTEPAAGAQPPAPATPAAPPWLHDPLTPDQQTLLDALLAEPDDPPVPDTDRLQLTERVLQAPVHGLRGYLLRRYAQWCSGEGGRLDRAFVNLILLVDHGLQHDGPRHEIDATARPGGRYDLLAELLTERAAVQAWVLVGLPGSGKSTVLKHHELGRARQALRALVGSGAPRPEICIWHRLSEYRAADPDPADWLQRRWPTGLPPLTELRHVVRVRYLLDGLNEIQAGERSAQLDAVGRWTAWAAAWAASGEPAPVFSVRTLDQSPMSLGDFEVRQVTLAPWSDQPDGGQIRAFCTHQLGEGNTLWPAIAADRELLKLSELPFNLAAQCELFRSLQRAARDRAELMGGLYWQMLERRLGDPALQPAELLGTQDRQLAASRQWRQKLRALPAQGSLTAWLKESAQRLQRRGRQVSVRESELLALLGPLPPPCQGADPARWLYAVRSLQLIDLSSRAEDNDEYSTEPVLRYTHQLWQEFFAAHGVRDLPQRGADTLPDLRPPALPALDTTLADLGKQAPLPGPDPSHWEEPVKLAVQLVPDPLPWLRALQPQNLALAGRAAVACRRQIEQVHGQAVLDELRQALLARSRDPKVDVRLRIEAGLVLGELGDPRYEERQGPHGRYLWPKQWVLVPGGVYRIGDDGAPYDREKPETEVMLTPFEMAFAPVTNAEYRCFIDAGGYQDEQWWQGETALRWLKEGVRNEVEIERVGDLFAELRDNCEAWVSMRPHLTASDLEYFRDLATKTETEHIELLDQWYGARRFALPQEWNNPLFNALTQPVVGLCQFEAQAYARWLQAQSGRAVRLPSEAEWEAAARGQEGRRWPWGDADPERWQINADPAHLRRTSPVGVFAQADTPDGLTDLAGNVWAWTTSLYTDRLDDPDFNTQAPDGLAPRAVRGGSWSNPTNDCRTSFRNRLTPDYRNDLLGMRLVASGPIPGTEP